eukprot:530295-Rhodomonas_salina.2
MEVQCIWDSACTLQTTHTSRRPTGGGRCSCCSSASPESAAPRRNPATGSFAARCTFRSFLRASPDPAPPTPSPARHRFRNQKLALMGLDLCNMQEVRRLTGHPRSRRESSECPGAQVMMVRTSAGKYRGSHCRSSALSNELSIWSKPSRTSTCWEQKSR